jgi:hypothetical protein
MAIDTYSVQLSVALLEGSTTKLPSPGAAVTGDVVEAHGGLPFLVAGGATERIRLGTLTDPAAIAIYGDEGIRVRIEEDGSWIPANPFAFLWAVVNSMSVSEVWVNNQDNEEHQVTIIAVES